MQGTFATMSRFFVRIAEIVFLIAIDFWRFSAGRLFLDELVHFEPFRAVLKSLSVLIWTLATIFPV